MGQLFQGIPREDIPWFPMVNPERCDNCLKCLQFCRYGVYEVVDDKLDVAQPFNCLVGCSRCESVCPQKAIAFMSARDLGMFLQMLRRQRAGLT